MKYLPAFLGWFLVACVSFFVTKDHGFIADLISFSLILILVLTVEIVGRSQK